MESSRKLFSAILVLMLLLVATYEMGGPVVVAEARTCESPSGRFKGPCILPFMCNEICQWEGFQKGKCGGFLYLKCMCTKQCVR